MSSEGSRTVTLTEDEIIVLHEIVTKFERMRSTARHGSNRRHVEETTRVSHTKIARDILRRAKGFRAIVDEKAPGES